MNLKSNRSADRAGPLVWVAEHPNTLLLDTYFHEHSSWVVPHYADDSVNPCIILAIHEQCFGSFLRNCVKSHPRVTVFQGEVFMPRSPWFCQYRGRRVPKYFFRFDALRKVCPSLLCSYKVCLENTQVINASIFNHDLPVVREGKIMQIGPESEQWALYILQKMSTYNVLWIAHFPLKIKHFSF